MKNKIIISGFGGQGIMLAGTMLCNAGMSENKSVTFFPAYGAEMRGGTANCQVIISDNSIGSPVIYAPDILISLNKPSFNKFHAKVKPGGLILVNSSLYTANAPAGTVNLVEVPANNLAEECGSVLVANIVMLGVLIAKTKILEQSSILNTIPEVLSEKKQHLWDINKKAAETGYNFIKNTSL